MELKGAQLAAKLGLKRSAIAQYETGRSFPSVSVLKKLTQALGVTMDYLVFDEYEATGQIQDKELVAYFAKADRLQTHERALIKMFLQKMLIEQEPEGTKPSGTRKGKAA
jgi:transcriptional regulator with XRE-family HTH domain